MFDSCLDPTTRCWTLHADGPWEPSPPLGSGVVHVRDHQAEMMLRHAASAPEAE
jgi:polyphosphate kinase